MRTRLEVAVLRALPGIEIAVAALGESRRRYDASTAPAAPSADGYDPWDFFGEPCPKPIVVAVHGACNTLGIELALASQLDMWAQRSAAMARAVTRSYGPAASHQAR